MKISGGVFSNVSKTCSYLEQDVYSKSSMVAISHAIEEVVLQSGLKADMYVCFQNFDFFLKEQTRYLELARYCNRIYIYATAIDYHQLMDIASKAENIRFIEISSISSLADEWNVMVDHREAPMMLVTREVTGEEEGDDFDMFAWSQEEDFRLFKGYLTFEPEPVRYAISLIRRITPEVILWLPGEESLFLTVLQQDSGGKCGAKESIQVMEATETKPRRSSEAVRTPSSDAKASQENASIKSGLPGTRARAFINLALNEIEAETRQLQKKNVRLQSEKEKNKQASFEMIKRLCFAAEYQDKETALHLIRMSYFAQALYRAYGADQAETEMMRYAALTHDIGKIGVPDRILLKEEPLDDEEYKTMQKHTRLGAEILADSRNRMIQMAWEICYYHHEKFDGSGYPEGLAGEDIPVPARIVAIADVFDVLTSPCVNKPAYSWEDALAYMEEGRDKHFDGRLLDLFLDIGEEVYQFKRKVERQAQYRTKTELLRLHV